MATTQRTNAAPAHPTQRSNEFLPLVHASHIAHSHAGDLTGLPGWWRKLKEGVGNFWFTNSVVNFCCCTSPDTHYSLQLKRQQNQAVRRELLSSLSYYSSDSSIIREVAEDARADGFDMLTDGPTMQTTARLPVGLTIHPRVPRLDTPQPEPRTLPTGSGQLRGMSAEAVVTDVVEASAAADTPPVLQEEVDAVFRPPTVMFGSMAPIALLPRQGVLHQSLNWLVDASTAPSAPPPSTPNVEAPPVPRDLRPLVFVPRFAAAVIVAIRARIGQLSASVPGNLLIVEREALRLMRRYNVREVDSVAHLPSIISCYFREDVHYQVETSAARMTRFQRWLMSEPSSPSTFAPLA